MYSNVDEIPQSIQDYSDLFFDYKEAEEKCLMVTEDPLSEDEMEDEKLMEDWELPW